MHITAVQKAGYTDLVQGVRVSYEIRPDREGNPTAESLRFGIPPPTIVRYGLFSSTPVWDEPSAQAAA